MSEQHLTAAAHISLSSLSNISAFSSVAYSSLFEDTIETHGQPIVL